MSPPKSDPAKNLNCIAFQAVNAAYPQSSSQKLECGGFIVQKTDQSYYYTPAFAGSQISMGSNFYTQYNNLVLSLKTGLSVAGWYHDHPIGPLDTIRKNFLMEIVELRTISVGRGFC